jgi:hypothetical protein
MNKLLFSVTMKDLEMQTFSAPGAGGGGKDTSSNCVRLVHKASGAMGEGREHRSLTQNRKDALLHLVNSKKFKSWHRIETARRMGQPIPETPEQIMVRIDRMVDEALKDGTIKIEYLENGGV